MIVGEAPGQNEDEQGIPFCGRSGALLSCWLKELGVDEESVYIANIVKCRPPENRNPSHGESAKCAPFLHLQIMVIKPKVIVALGRVAATYLSEQAGASLKALREKEVLVYQSKETGMSVPLVASYHPSYILRREGGFKPEGEANKMVLDDLRKAIGISRECLPT
jgi:DNA polymerase